MVMSYIQEFERCNGTIDASCETIFIRASCIDAVSEFAEGRVWLYMGRRSWQVKGDIQEIVDWMNHYAPSID